MKRPDAGRHAGRQWYQAAAAARLSCWYLLVCAFSKASSSLMGWPVSIAVELATARMMRVWAGGARSVGVDFIESRQMGTCSSITFCVFAKKWNGSSRAESVITKRQRKYGAAALGVRCWFSTDSFLYIKRLVMMGVCGQLAELMLCIEIQGLFHRFAPRIRCTEPVDQNCISFTAAFATRLMPLLSTGGPQAFPPGPSLRIQWGKL